MHLDLRFYRAYLSCLYPTAALLLVRKVVPTKLKFFLCLFRCIFMIISTRSLTVSFLSSLQDLKFTQLTTQQQQQKQQQHQQEIHLSPQFAIRFYVFSGELEVQLLEQLWMSKFYRRLLNQTDTLEWGVVVLIFPCENIIGSWLEKRNRIIIII